MRQKDDLSFATALNNMASEKMTLNDIALLESRCFTIDLLPSESDGAIHLFATNKEVDDYNNRILSAMKTEGSVVRAIDIVSGAPNNVAKRKALTLVKSLPTVQTYGLPKLLIIKIAARFMITINLNTSDGLVNGTTGILRAIDFGTNKNNGERRPLRLWMDFNNKNIGKSARNSFKSPNRRNLGFIINQWTPLELITYTIKRWKSSNLIVRQTQFPIIPAEGITIHKSQGATMEKVVVHVNQNIRRSMLYVACSRATAASGLFIV